MVSKNKARGNSLERQVVQVFDNYKIPAKRAWGSNGEALGMDKEVDVLVNTEVPLKIQCKKKKKLPDWLGMTDKIDAVVFMEDRGKKYIMFPLEMFIKGYLL